MIENGETGAVQIKQANHKTGDLKNADLFLQNGAFSVNEKDQEVYIVGQEFVHILNTTNHRFKTLRAINRGKQNVPKVSPRN